MIFACKVEKLCWYLYDLHHESLLILLGGWREKCENGGKKLNDPRHAFVILVGFTPYDVIETVRGTLIARSYWYQA